MLFAGVLVAGAGFVLAGRRVERTVYRPDPWRAAGVVVAASASGRRRSCSRASRIDPTQPESVADLRWRWRWSGAPMLVALVWHDPPPVLASAGPRALIGPIRTDDARHALAARRDRTGEFA